MTHYDIIIVGGGIAGLRFALEAKKRNRNFKILILEKYEKTGGRIYTQHSVIDEKKIQYECGAGRIHSSHKKTLELLKHYKLTTIPLDKEKLWRSYGSQESVPNNFEKFWTEMCEQYNELPVEVKRAKTLRDLAFETMDTGLAKNLLETYSYRAELEVASAESGIDLYLSLKNGHFVIVAEGFSELIHRMTKDAKEHGIEIKYNVTIEHININKDKSYTAKSFDNKTYAGDRVVIAVHRNALQTIYPFSMEHPLVKSVQMEPLMRIYSVYKDASWFPEHTTITNSPLRNIIPINKSTGVIMSSYLDSRDLELWTDLHKKSKRNELIEKVHNETLALFSEKTIKEKPIQVDPQYWSDGCSYWLAGTDYKALSNLALQPYPIDYPKLHIIGESFSTKQQWVEGAIEHADSLIALVYKK